MQSHFIVKPNLVLMLGGGFDKNPKILFRKGFFITLKSGVTGYLPLRIILKVDFWHFIDRGEKKI